MRLATGGRLGPYEIVAPLGSGGMGEVYRARDTRLGREVAIKILPADRLADPENRARFEREARAVAALNHPHIVTLHDVASADGVDFIVMEYVAGKTLDRLIPSQGMPCAEVLRLAIPMADAVARAHAAGIVHRDLKPSNVVVNAEGTAKVLDFGLAKLLGPATEPVEAEAEAETATAQSLPGRVVGTAGYMSPEQASGRNVDERSDVFSFGAVLYEMVTGRRAFAGDSELEALAALLKEEPRPPSELVGEVPKELERIILRCLRKEPERRFQNMLDVRVELQEVKEESGSAAATALAEMATRRSHCRRLVWIAAAVAALALATAAALWHLRRPELPAPRLVQLGWTGHDIGGTFSPDGNQIAFRSHGEKGDNWGIWLRIIGETEARQLTAGADDAPAWSPDGRQIAFVRSAPEAAAGNIHLVSPLGGPARRLVDFPTSGDGQLSWSPDGRWLAAARARAKGEPPPEWGAIHLIPVGGGEPLPVTSPQPLGYDVCPAFAPDGRALAFASCAREQTPACDVYVLPLDSEHRPHSAARRLTDQEAWISGLAWTRDGRSIVYGAGVVWRVRQDGGSPPEPVELTRGGDVMRLATAHNQDRLTFTWFRWAPDIYRLEPGESPTPLIASTASEVFPQYSPDGRHITFASDRSGASEIWLAEADGSNPTRLTHGPGQGPGSPRWSPDGRSIAFDSQGEDGRYDVWTIDIDGSGLRQITRDPSDENMPSWSRDGRFIYFSSNRTGRDEVWRVPSGGGTEEQITREGGCVPFESLDGRTLYYMRSCANDALLARPTAGGTERMLSRCVDTRSYAAGPKGVFHVDCQSPGASSQRVLRHWSASTGQDQPVGTFESDWVGGLSASPDGRSVLYLRSTHTQDLMLIENFR